MQPDHTCDVLVCGGGIAGIAAALEAARAGMRTVLLEKTVLLGGLATAGLIWAFPPLCDASGTQVMAGIVEELYRLSYRYGPGEPKQHPVGRDWVIFSPASLVLALDEVLLAAGVEIWLDTLVCEPVTAGDRVCGVEAETKAGRVTFRAQVVIDATGDADIAFRSGAACVPASNLLAMWALEASVERASQVAESGDGAALLDMLLLGVPLPDRARWAAEKTWTGLDAPSVTAFVLEGRRLLRERYAAGSAPADRYPITLPAMAQFRTTRRVVGRTTISDSDRGRRQPDSVGVVSDWRELDQLWEFPYGALIPERIGGLLVAGRCLAAEEEAWEVMRVIAPVALSGQAAGLGAALAVRGGVSPGSVSAEAMQRELTARGISFRLDGRPTD